MRNKWIYTIFVLALTLFASCSDNMEEAGTGGKSRKVVFRLSMDDALGSRGAWNEAYESVDGNIFEKSIKGDSLRVAIFNTENVMLGEVQSLLHWTTDVEGNEYEFVGDFSHVTGLIPGDEYKIMVLANASSQDVTAWNNMQYDFKQLAMPTGSLPMWGVKQVNLTLEELQNIGTIDLLRAVAKVEVSLSSDMANKYTLENVFIDKVRGGGYFFPTGWHNVTATTSIDQTLGFRSGNAALLGNTFFKLNEAKSSAVIYLPEYNNIDFDPASITLSVKEKNSNLSAMVYPNAISFCQYGDDGKAMNNTAYNIVRNHFYQYTITNIKGDGLELVYLVADWENGGTFVHTFDYPTYHNPVVDAGYFDPSLSESQRKSYTITTVPQMVYSSDATSGNTLPFTCWFKIDGPEGKSAKPSLAGSTSNYEIEVYKKGEKVTDNLCIADALNWYEIKVIPKVALPVDINETTVKLGIVYNQQWMPSDSHIHLYINGDANNIAWPESGSDPKHIEIKQVRQSSNTNS